MALSKQTATAIVNVVSRDAESFSRINAGQGDSVLTRIAPESWGITGDLRNIGFIIVNADPTTTEVANFVCTGIAEASSEAISKALNGTPGIPEVQSAGMIDRYKPAAHTATLIVMKDGGRYVFDWHKSLNVSNPWIFHAADWEKNRNGVLFTKFQGW